MKTIQYILAVCLIALLSFSCIKDNSVGEIHPVSKIEPAGKIDTLFNVDRWERLRIVTPEFKQTNTEKQLSYSWEIDNKEVSKEKDLNYVCEKFGIFTGRLKVSNEDGFFFHHFKVDVRYSYVKGVYALASYKGNTILSYIPEDVEGKKPELDIYEKNNPQLKLGSEPKALFFTNTPVRQQVYIATGNPSMLYRLDGNLMTATARIDTKQDVTFITHDGSGSSITDIKFIINKRVANLASNSNVITNGPQQSFERILGQIELANSVSYWYSSGYKNANGELYFDNLNSRMFINSDNATESVQELFKSKFIRMTLVGICLANNKSAFAAVFKNKQSGELVHFWFNPGYYNQYNPAKEIAPEIKYQGIMPLSSGITDASLITSAPAKNLMYYTNGNKVYAYSILSKGNFPTQPLFICGNNGEIASLFVNKDESKLYVGINDNNPDLPGSIYCFDLNKNTLLWKQEHVTGKICQLDYKYN